MVHTGKWLFQHKTHKRCLLIFHISDQVGLFSLEFPRFPWQKSDLNEREMGEQTHVPRPQQSSPLLASQPQLTSDELGEEKINVIDRRASEERRNGPHTAIK